MSTWISRLQVLPTKLLDMIYANLVINLNLSSIDLIISNSYNSNLLLQFIILQNSEFYFTKSESAIQI